VENFQKHFQFWPFLRWSSLWWIPSRIAFMKFAKMHYSMFQSLDDIHASVPDLKYRSPFLLTL
jgi:hypothetical protein